ncbi:MAG: IS21-like element helper ATPase IstB [Exilibacterium sp.]
MNPDNLKQPLLIDTLKQQALDLSLHGLLAHWEELTEEQLRWIACWLEREEIERSRRGLERRLRNARIGRFKPMADFDWDWPKQIDRNAIMDSMGLSFITEASNIILVGPNGVGKSTVAQNIAHYSVVQGHTVLFTSAAQMLNELAAIDSDMALRRKLRFYSQPAVLAIDEVGYLSYGNRHADLLFEVINRRYEKKSTIITTNKPFAQWGEVFPNAACVVSLIDRLIHHAEIISIDGDSYRMKEAKERTERRKQKRKANNQKTNPQTEASKL